VKRLREIYSAFEPTLRHIREAELVLSDSGDPLNILKVITGKLDTLKIKYEQLLKSIPVELHSLLSQLDKTSGVEKLMKIGYGSFFLP